MPTKSRTRYRGVRPENSNACRFEALAKMVTLTRICIFSKTVSFMFPVTPFHDLNPFFVCVPLFNPHLIPNATFHLRCCRVTPQDGDTSPSGADEPTGATGGAGAMAISASSTLSLPMSQGKPSLRRIKGRIHRSKSLDSIDLLESSVRPSFDPTTPVCPLVINRFSPSNG